jgi:hypothetical protein
LGEKDLMYLASYHHTCYGQKCAHEKKTDTQ